MSLFEAVPSRYMCPGSRRPDVKLLGALFGSAALVIRTIHARMLLLRVGPVPDSDPS